MDNEFFFFFFNPQYGRQINVEEKVWRTLLNHFHIFPG
jgi:hypothetical protein